MTIQTTRVHYDGHNGEQSLCDKINSIGYENILQILPCYCGSGEHFYTIIYKESDKP